MPEFGGKDLIMACRCFKAKTGIGTDCIHPRTLLLLPTAGLQAVVDILKAIERSGAWPEHQRHIMYFLILKANGKDRPIGLLPSLIRVWEAIRAPVLWAWQRDHPEDWNWSSEGRAAEDAAWEALLHIEGGQLHSEESTVSVVMDLVKAFERVQLAEVWRRALHLGFPRRLLHVVLTYFGFARRLVVNGCASEPVSTVAAIVAGSRFSVCFLRLVLTEPMTKLKLIRPEMQLKVYVDDILVQLQGRRRDLIEAGPQVAEECIELLAKVGLEVSRGTRRAPGGKSGALTPCPAVRKAIQGPMNQLGIAVTDHYCYLGVDMTASRKTRQLVREARKKMWGLRIGKLTKLGKAGKRKAVRGGVRKVLKTGLWPSFAYGFKCLGVRPADVKKCRTSMARLIGRGRGSTTIKLALSGMEPGPSFAVPPVAQWAQKAWAGDHDRLMHRAWLRQAMVKFTAPNVQLRPGIAQGPAEAVAAAMRAAEWTWTAPFRFTSRSGEAINVKEHCPEDVKALYLADVAAKQWAEWTEQDRYKELQPAPLMAPVRAWFRRHRDSTLAAGVRTLVQKGMVTQSVLHEWEWVATDRCKACGLAAGTPQHRLYECEKYRESRAATGHRRWAHVAGTEALAGKRVLLWTRGLMSAPSAGWGFKPPPPGSTDLGWHRPDGDWAGYFTGDAYTDGSKLGTSRWSQCGWSVVLGSSATAASYGAMPVELSVQRRIKRAELWAVLRALQAALPPICVHTDHMGIVQGVAKGRRWRCGPCRPHADVWRQIWAKLDDLGFPSEAVAFKHVKAHRTATTKASLTPEEQRHAKGNEAADVWAKLGASGDSGCGREQVMQEASEKVRWTLDYLAESLEWPEAFGKWEDVEAQLVKPKPRRTLEVGPRRPHCMEERPDRPGQWVCRGCGTRAATKTRATKLQWRVCPGTVLKKAVAAPRPTADLPESHATFLGHHIFRYGTLHFCRRCGYYAEHRSVGLERPCTGQPAKNYGPRLSLLAAGRHPKSGKELGGPPVRVMPAEVREWQRKAAA